MFSDNLEDEHVMCCRSKLNNFLEQTELTKSLGKKQLELSTSAWLDHVPWNCSKFVCQVEGLGLF